MIMLNIFTNNILKISVLTKKKKKKLILNTYIGIRTKISPFLSYFTVIIPI